MPTILALSCQAKDSPLCFLVTKRTSLLGRSSHCDFLVGDDSISRKHAEISIVGSHLFVRDLRSRNGTFLDGARIEASIVEVGQRMRFGQVDFLVTAVTETPEVSNSEIDTKVLLQSEEPSSLGRLGLSKAQRRVVRLLIEGLSEKKIARKLRLSPFTVHNHVQAAHRKLGVHSRAELLIRILKPRQPQTQ